MDKRLTQLLESGIEITDTCMLDTYNQQVQDNVSCTIRTNINTANHHFIMGKESYRIRKLTERECFRLMGLADTDITKIQASGVSRSQQYKMAGNSIVVDVLFHIFRKLYIEPQCEHQQLTLF